MTDTIWEGTADLICNVLDGNPRASRDASSYQDLADIASGCRNEPTVREVARLLRERHPELVEPPWTPVAEGLPEKPGWWDTTVTSDSSVFLGRATKQVFWNGFRWNAPGDLVVLAWRPAPPPWNGGQ